MKFTMPKLPFKLPKEKLTRFFKKGLRKILPQYYILVVLIELALAGFYPFIPKLTYCSSLFGETFCTPLGFFVAMLGSIPGYLIVGNVLKFLPAIHPIWSILLVIVVSYVFYYFLGLVLEIFFDRSRSSQEKMKLIIVIVFFLLAFLAISFA